MKLWIISSALGLSAACFAANPSPSKPLAIVYDGPGSCPVSEGDCTGAATKAAESAGYEVVKVGPDALTAKSTESDYVKVFGKAALWVQPGGSSRKFLLAVSPETKAGIQRFVKAGHGYVGFCAGAFSATERDGDLNLPGLGIMPGKTHPYPNETVDVFFDDILTHFNPDAYYNQILEVTWNGKKRHVYFEEGPSFDFNSIPKNFVDVTARLKNGLPVSARAAYGQGRVYLTGLHPEATDAWKEGLTDPDGSDYDLVKEMMDWSAGDVGKKGVRP